MLIIILLVLEWGVSNAGHVQYECGPHGRFEYCIDDFPGCVIGCYCHPGYYFDTESKICEPNIKLTKGYRRSDDTNEVYNPPIAVTTPKQIKTTKSNPDIVGDKVNKITHSVDELSNWLFNEFFQATENQVVNNTDENIELVNGRRKSNNVKKIKKHRSNKKKKNKRMKITENDSLFDSSSSSSSSESKSDDSDSGGDSYEKNKSDDHQGQRKIVLIHKKPKTSIPSLPSFLFVPPGGGTDYYPPVQIPGAMFPPPLLPLPPMLTPFAPSVIVIDANSNSSRITENPIDNTKSPTEIKNEKPVKNTTESKPLNTVISTTTDVPTEDNNESKDSKGEITEAITTENSIKDQLRKRSPKGKQNSMYKRNKNTSSKKSDLKKILKKLKPPIQKNNPIPFVSEEGLPVIDEDMMVQNELYRRSINPYKNTKVMDSNRVNIKYLVQLIHKNNEKNNNPFQYENNQSIIRDVGRLRQTDKANKQLKNKDDYFYSELGKEIASLVRKVEFNNNNNEKEVNIEIQSLSNNIPQIINKNEFPLHSYWERFVRSPSDLVSFNNPIIFLDSNEELQNIENIVRKTATESPNLSLTELETIIKIMDQKNPITDKDENSNIYIPNKVKYTIEKTKIDHPYKMNKSELQHYNMVKNSSDNEYTKTALVNYYNYYTEVLNRNNNNNGNDNKSNTDKTSKRIDNMRYIARSKISNHKNYKYFKDDNVSTVNKIEAKPQLQSYKEKSLYFAEGPSA